ncbi:MAG: tyrosine-type recombinase/integrase, partial [Luteitalea sp.]|nr:tyrosine-type recombinase/integrase [Luteitalea sp.]
DQVDLENKVVWIPDSKTPNGVAEAPLTDLAVEAIRGQMQLAGNSEYLFPRENCVGHQTTFKTAWRATLRRAKVPYFRIYDLRSTYATRLSAGGVADEWVTQLSQNPGRLVGSAVQLLQCLALHLKLHLRVLLEDFCIALPEQAG